MTDIDWGKLAEPFPDADVKQRPGAATWEHKPNCAKQQCRETRDPSKHIQFSYVDARAVAQRLDDVVTPAGWDFSVELQPGDVVKGKLVVAGIVREDVGYPNSDDDAEPYKSAVSDALKRCAVLFGIGRHLYDDNKNGHRPTPTRPAPVRLAPRTENTAPNAPAIAEIMASLPDDPYGDDLMGDYPVPVNKAADDTTCPEHGIAWIGSFGDRYHKKPEGGYCRSAAGNVAKPRR